MIKYRVTLGDPPIITEHEIEKVTTKNFIDDHNRAWPKHGLKDYRWFDSYTKALEWIEIEYKMRKYVLEIEYESVCRTLSDIQSELRQGSQPETPQKPSSP